MSNRLRLRVHSLTWEAVGVLSVELQALDGRALPAYEPGAHIDLHLPRDIVRSYSLAGDPADRNRYVIGVGLDAKSRGGSAYIHSQLRPGQELDISPPRNNFPLADTSERSVLIAGGIGVTPILCMARALVQRGRLCEVHYAVRSANRAAFAKALQALGMPLHLHIDAENDGKPLDVAAIIAAQPGSAHLYCCGPAPMLAAFESATAGRPAETVHVEYFAPKAQTTPTSGPASFTVVLGRTGREIAIPADKSILDTLLAEGVAVESSCHDGICGTCEVKVLEGQPDHRDSVLTTAERDAGKMLICVSRSKGERLVLDLG